MSKAIRGLGAEIEAVGQMIQEYEDDLGIVEDAAIILYDKAAKLVKAIDDARPSTGNALYDQMIKSSFHCKTIYRDM